MKRFLLLPLLLAPALAQAGPNHDAAALEAHVTFLASDAMRGRDTGSPELAIAEQYVAAQMLAAGLKPAGDQGGWLQKVPLIAYKPADKGSMALKRGGTITQLEWGKDYLTRGLAEHPKLTLSAPVVFAGYGVTTPGHDDYKGLDVRGKIVAVLRDAPRNLPSEVRAHLGRPDEQARTAAAHGAVGVILIEGNARHAVYPFARTVGQWDSEAMAWAGPDGKPQPGGAPAFAYLGFDGAARLFEGSKIKWADVLAADAAGKKLRTGPLGVTVEATTSTAIHTLSANNVVGVLPGSDPALKDEYIALSAHLDHVGVGTPDAKGDTIYNGAMDNAVGIGSMIEVARRFQREGTKPRRSLLFVAVTAEEVGLVGSDYFALHPSVAPGTLVANVNLDMPIITYAFEDLIAYGADRSSIGPVVAKVAEANGAVLTPDPAPEQASFVRSDHYSFVRAGVPSVSLEPGTKGPGDAAQKEFIDKHYHEPSDQLDLPFDWAAGVRFVKINYEVARALADADARPRWNKGDFFGTLYRGYGAE